MQAFRHLGVVFLLVSSVAPVTAQEKMRESPYYPLQVGNTWTYRFGEDAVGQQKFVLKVTKHEKIGDTVCARVEMLIDDKVSEVEHLSVAEDGIYRHAISGLKIDKPVCILKLPPKKGAMWKLDSKGADRTLTGDVEGDIVDEVKVDAGTYKSVARATCKEFDANGLKGSFTNYYAEGVGLVKQQWKQGNSKEFFAELVKFEPGKK